MKNILCACLLLLTGNLFAEVLEIKDLSGGLNDSSNVYNIPDNCVTDCMNIDFDEDYMIQKRKGIKKYSSELGGGKPIFSMYEYVQSDGDIYNIYQSSTSLYYKTEGGGYTSFYTAISSSTVCEYTTFMNRLFFCDGNINLSTFDGATVSVATTTYQPKYLATWQNRLWIAGDSTNPSQIVSSAYLDYTDWVLTSTADTGAQSFDINSSDGKSVVGFFYSPNGNLGIVKNGSIWELSGIDASDFYIRLVSNNMGSIYGGWTYRNNDVIFVSQTGIYLYDGNSFSRISDNVQENHANIKQLDRYLNGIFNKYNYDTWSVYNSTYNITFTGDTIQNYNDALVSSNTWLYGDLGLYGYTDGYIDEDSNIYIVSRADNLGITADKILEMKYDSNMNNEYSYVIDYSSYAYTLGNIQLHVGSDNSRHLTYIDAINNSGNYRLKYASSTVDQTWYINVTTPSVFSFDSCLDANNNFHVLFTTSSTSPRIYYSSITAGSYFNTPVIVSTWTPTSVLSPSIYVSSSNVMYIAWSDFITRAGGDDYQLIYSSKSVSASSFNTLSVSTGTDTINRLDNINVFCSGTNTPYFLYGKSSRIYMTYKPAATWTTIVASTGTYTNIYDVLYHPYDELLTYVCKSTAYNAEYTMYDLNPINNLYTGTWNNNEINGKLLNRLYNTHSSFPNNSELALSLITYDSGSSRLANNIYYSSYSYVSEVYDSSITDTISISSFTVSDLSYCPAYHYIRSSDTVSNIASTAWTAVTNNTIPAITAGRYYQYMNKNQGYYFSSTNNDISDMAQRYSIRAPQYNLSCANYKNRNYIGISTSTLNNLELILVYDKNGAWTKYYFNGLDFRTMQVMNNILYIGGTDGYIYKFDEGFNDNINTIDSYIISKDYVFDSLFKYKTVDMFYISGDDTEPVGSYLNFYYWFNGYYDNSSPPNYFYGFKSITDIKEQNSLNTNIFNYKYVLNKKVDSLSTRFKLENNSTDDMKLNNILINYRPDNMR